MRKRMLVKISGFLLLLFLVGCQQSGIISTDEDNSDKQGNSSISGKIYRADNGEPIAGATIWVHGNHSYSTGPITARTAGNGRYQVKNLDAGDSIVIVEAEGFVPRYYNGAEGTYQQGEALHVTTTVGDNTVDIDIALEWGGSITGHVYMPDGVTSATDYSVSFVQLSGPTTPIWFKGIDTGPYHPVKIDNEGKYTISGLNTGDYSLEVLMREGIKLYYAYLDGVHVTIGEETSETDLVLMLGGSISGHVYMNDGVTPVNKKSINILHQNGSFSYSLKSASDGSYSFRYIPPGEYIVEGKMVIVYSGQDTVYDIILPD